MIRTWYIIDILGDSCNTYYTVEYTYNSIRNIQNQLLHLNLTHRSYNPIINKLAKCNHTHITSLRTTLVIVYMNGLRAGEVGSTHRAHSSQPFAAVLTHAVVPARPQEDLLLIVEAHNTQPFLFSFVCGSLL